MDYVRILQLSFSSSLVLIFGYALRYYGVPAWLMVAGTGIVGILTFFKKKKTFEALSFLLGFFSGIAFYLFFYYVYARGPSFANAVFILSFTGIYLFLWLAFYTRDFQRAIPMLAPIFVTWAFVANWEFPSTFSPFLLYGHVEIYKLLFPLSLTLLILLVDSEKRISEFSFFAGFLVAAFFGFLEKGVKTFDRYDYAIILLLFTIFSVLFFLSLLKKPTGEKSSVVFTTIGFTLIPAIISFFSLFQSFFGVYLPLPFEKEGTIGAVTLLILSIAALSVAVYKDVEEHFENQMLFVIPVASVFLASLFVPFEKNIFIYEDFEKAFLVQDGNSWVRTSFCG